MLIRVPLLFLWNLIRNLLRLPFVLIGAVIRLFRKRKPQYIRMTIKHGLPRWQSDNWLKYFRDEEPSLTLPGWKKRLATMENRADVKGLLIDVHRLGAGLTAIHELCEMISHFRQSFPESPRVVVFIRNHLGMGEFILGAEADEIVIQPSATVYLAAPAMEGMYFAPLMKRFGVEMVMERVGEHKNAPESMTRGFPSPTHRADMEEMLQGIRDAMLPPLAKARNIDLDAFHEYLHQGVFSEKEALALGLIDAIRYADRLDDFLQQEDAEPFEYPEHPRSPRQSALDEGEDSEEEPTSEQADVDSVAAADTPEVPDDKVKPAETVPLVDWGDVNWKGTVWWRWTPLRKQPAVAVIPIIGAIVDESSEESGGGDAAVRDPVISLIDEAHDDSRVKAAIVYINSRGGSGYASEAIWHALRRLDAEKPVFAFLDDYAASGGYYIACGARKIIANPWCITGSIGVFGGKPVAKALLDRLQIGLSPIGASPASRMYSPFAVPTEEERAQLRAQLALFYERFLLRVADNRNRSTDEIDHLAQGRVYLATDAKEVGLVDQLGSFDDVFEMAKKEVGLQKAQLLFLESSPSFSVRTLMNIAAQTRQPVRLGADALLSPSPESLLPLLRTFSSTREWDTVMSILAREGLLTWFDSSLILR